MFNKKPAPPPAPPKPAAAAPAPQAAAPARGGGWPMLALTADYGVMGSLPPVDMPLTGFMNVPTQATVTLSGAQMQALGNYRLVSETTPEATFPKTSLLILVPRDEAGVRSAMQQMPPQSHRAVLYVGPFLVRAALRVAGDMPLRNAMSVMPNTFFALSDAEVQCQISGSRFPPLKSPVIIVNKLMVQFYQPG